MVDKLWLKTFGLKSLVKNPFLQNPLLKTFGVKYFVNKPLVSKVNSWIKTFGKRNSWLKYLLKTLLRIIKIRILQCFSLINTLFEKCLKKEERKFMVWFWPKERKSTEWIPYRPDKYISRGLRGWGKWIEKGGGRGCRNGDREGGESGLNRSAWEGGGG